jgi:hypothetical protein
VLALLAVATAAPACRKTGDPSRLPEQEILSRTEFTDRLENFFEYQPLHAGRPSRFVIHLTDLSEGDPVAEAEVSLTARSKGAPIAACRARPGRLAGIYVAELTLPAAGDYSIDFHVRHRLLDERMPLDGFTAR